MTNNFTFFESYYESVEHLDAEIKAEFFDLLFKYALRDEDASNNATPIVKALFIMAKPNLDKSKARREAGKQGGSKPKQTASKPKQTLSDKEKEKEKEKDKEIIKEIVDDLNLVCGTKFKSSSDATASSIRARLSEKYTLEDFKKVHRVKFDEWKDTEMVKHLNPSTLYRPSNFEKYVNQAYHVKTSEGGITW